MLNIFSKYFTQVINLIYGILPKFHWLKFEHTLTFSSENIASPSLIVAIKTICLKNSSFKSLIVSFLINLKQLRQFKWESTVANWRYNTHNATCMFVCLFSSSFFPCFYFSSRVFFLLLFIILFCKHFYFLFVLLNIWEWRIWDIYSEAPIFYIKLSVPEIK